MIQSRELASDFPFDLALEDRVVNRGGHKRNEVKTMKCTELQT